MITVFLKVLSLQRLEGLKKTPHYRDSSGPWVVRCTNLL
jgi:hypothetical protein